VAYNTADEQPATEHSYSFPVTYAMMPNVHVLASYVRDDGEIVADFTEITVAVALENQVRFLIFLCRMPFVSPSFH